MSGSPVVEQKNMFVEAAKHNDRALYPISNRKLGERRPT